MKKTPKIIAFCGPVGTGKSLCARLVESHLNAHGLSAYYLRYNHIGLKDIFSKKQKSKKVNLKFDKVLYSQPKFKEPDRFLNYRLRSNTWLLVMAVTSLLRAYLFFAFVKVRYAHDIVLIDRYIYDYLTIYNIKDKKAGWMFNFIIKMAPKPLLTIMLDADLEALTLFRSRYDRGYLKTTLENYAHLWELVAGSHHVYGKNICERGDKVIKLVNQCLIEKIIVHRPLPETNYTEQLKNYQKTQQATFLPENREEK
jgi:thymidylate kinase